jgi:redox-sensitive bicupin YhaK (pirin superfamily)
LTVHDRALSEVLQTPWRNFRGGDSGAWMLHLQDAHALDPVVIVDHFRMSQPTFAPHPHAGFSAVTYLFEDSEDGFINRDSLGHTLPIEPGALHWTQAGSGVMHEEIPHTPGRVSHGLQIFVNSSATHKQSAPAIFHRRADEIVVLEPAPGVRVRVVLGDFGGVTARVGAHTPITLLDITLAPHARLAVPLPAGERAFAVISRGALAERAANEPHALRFADEGDAVALHAGAQGAHLALLSGRPLAEPMFPKGPFIGSSAAEVTDMIRRFQSGAMGALAAAPGAFA